MRITVKARAKLNLTLNVEGMYDETYHRLSSVVTTVDVFDTVTVDTREDRQVAVTVNGVSDSNNTAYKVASAIVEEKNTQGVTITVQKGIAVMGGMGGSSVDGAATITALCNLFDLTLDEQILHIAKQCGSDIVYLLRGGLCLTSGKGDDITHIDTNNTLHFVVINGARLSVKDVFAEYDNFPDTARYDNQSLITALCNYDIESARSHLGNNLFPSAQKLAPQLIRILDICRQLGLPSPVMTGSGGNLFILCTSSVEAQRIVSLLSAKGLDCYTTHSSPYAIDVI